MCPRVVAEGGEGRETSCLTAPPHLPSALCARLPQSLPFPCSQGLRKMGNKALSKDALNKTFEGRGGGGVCLAGKASFRPGVWERARGAGRTLVRLGFLDLPESGAAPSHR